MKEAKSVCSELDMFAVHMSSNLFQATPSNLQNLWIDYMDVKRRAEEFVRKGWNVDCCLCHNDIVYSFDVIYNVITK